MAHLAAFSVKAINKTLSLTRRYIMKYGYARCSTNEDKQDIQRQIRELKAAGADEVIFEYEHGDAKVKQNLNMLLEHAADGDTIITLEVSRLTRSACASSSSAASPSIAGVVRLIR